MSVFFIFFEECLQECIFDCVGKWTNWGICTPNTVTPNCTGTQDSTYIITNLDQHFGNGCPFENGTIRTQSCSCGKENKTFFSMEADCFSKYMKIFIYR